MKLSHFLFLIGILFSPLYFFLSGGVQISDIFFVLSMLSLLFIEKKILESLTRTNPVFNFLKGFVVWVFIVNIVYYFIWGDIKTLLASIYYLYNFSLIVLLIGLFETSNKRFLFALYYMLFTSLLIVFIVAIFRLDYLFLNAYLHRRTLTFNNPNQLGYWTLLILSILIMVYKVITENRTSRLLSSILILSSVISFYLSMLSLSKAASLSILILLIFASIKKTKLILVIIGLMIVGFYLIGYNKSNFIGLYLHRLETVGESNDDNIEGRNYDRIWKYPEYLVFGAGEGAISERFEKDNEIHSSFGTILFSYGIIGFFLFLFFLVKLFKLNKLEFILTILPILAYGISHMGLRYKLFWISLAIFVILANKKKKNLYIVDVNE